MKKRHSHLHLPSIDEHIGSKEIIKKMGNSKKGASFSPGKRSRRGSASQNRKRASDKQVGEDFSRSLHPMYEP